MHTASVYVFQNGRYTHTHRCVHRKLSLLSTVTGGCLWEGGHGSYKVRKMLSFLIFPLKVTTFMYLFPNLKTVNEKDFNLYLTGSKSDKFS